MNADAKKVTTITTVAACHNSFHVGQVTFLSSCCVSRKKFVAFCTRTSSLYFESLIYRPYLKQAWQDSNLQHAVLETAALPIGATGLCPVCGSENLFLLPEKDALATTRTVFLPFDLVRILLFVLPRPISRLMVTGRHQGNNLLHWNKTFSFVLKKPQKIHGFKIMVFGL